MQVKTNILRRLVISISLASVIALSMLGIAGAQEPAIGPNLGQFGGACQTSRPAVEGSQDIAKGTYSVYVRLAKSDQQENVRLRYSSFTGTDCNNIGSAKATGEKWTKIGRLQLKKADFIGFSLETASHQGLPGANRPEILLVSTTSPVCEPSNDCMVEVGKRQGVISSTQSSIADNNLRIVVPIDPKNDTIKQVDYYVDSRHAYTDTEIADFDSRYIPSFEHTLTTVASYESGQQITFTEIVDRGYNDALNYYAFTLYEKNKNAIKIGTALLTVVVAANIGLFVTRKYFQRKLWQKTHIAKNKKLPTKEDYKHSKITPSLHITQPNELLDYARKFRNVGKYGLLGLTCLIVINSFILQPFTVDGESMQNTLQDGDSLLINKVGKLYTSVTRQQYLPKRGEIVVFEKTQTDFLGEQEARRYFVKRVIGLPGERVVVDKDKLVVYSSDGELNPDDNKPWSQDIIRSDLDDIDITLGADELFVVGDNRPGSVDSRYFGPIKLNQLVGDAVTRTLPKPRFF